LRVVAYGFYETAAFLNPTLSVINQDLRLIGKMTTKLFFNNIERKTSRQHINLKIVEDFIWNNSLKKLRKSK
jgi:DNA-binding LacI/PurR family transcriptional regulator